MAFFHTDKPPRKEGSANVFLNMHNQACPVIHKFGKNSQNPTPPSLPDSPFLPFFPIRIE